MPNRLKELRKLGEAADLIHCVSSDLFEQIQKYGINKKKCFINLPSIDTDFFTKFKNNDIIKSRIFYYYLNLVGRLHWVKDFFFCINFINTLKNNSIDVFYNIIGDGEELPKLKF